MSECKYKCGTKFSKYDSQKKKFYELDGTTLHTWDRHLQVLKNKKRGNMPHLEQQSNDPNTVQNQESNGHEGFCTKWHESYKVLNPYWRCCPYCYFNLEVMK